MYNKVILMGRITKDLELKTTLSGVSVLSFSIAVERSFKSKDGERVTDFFDCVAWRQTAEFISRFFAKGRAILVEGELQTRSYQDKNNVTRYVTEISVANASFTGERADTPQNGVTQQPVQNYSAPAQQPAAPANSPVQQYTAENFKNTGGGDDYPF